MKNAFIIALTLMLTLGMMAYVPQQEKGKGQQKKEQQAGKGKSNKQQQPPGRAKGNNGHPAQAGKPEKANQAQRQKNNAGRDLPPAAENRGNNGNAAKAKANNGKGKGNVIRGTRVIAEDDQYYRWTDETYVTRQKIRNAGKVTICHKLRGDEPPVTISVSRNALQAHLNHGDVQGDCPAYNRDNYSPAYWDRRQDYYEFLGQEYDQVVYSQSILDYAIARLTGARQQLVVMQNGSYPPETIEQKQLVVMELEQNVSLLEQLLGVAANLVVNKLMQ